MSKMKDSIDDKYDKFHNYYINKTLKKAKTPRASETVGRWTSELKKSMNTPISKDTPISKSLKKKAGTFGDSWSQKEKDSHQKRNGRAWND